MPLEIFFNVLICCVVDASLSVTCATSVIQTWQVGIVENACRITRVTHITKIFFVNWLRLNQSRRVDG